jgi:hypothetical protein
MPTKKPATTTKAAKKPAIAAKKSVATKTQPKTATGETAAVFARLKRILEKYEPALDLKDSSAVNYYLNSKKPWQKKELFFAATAVRKSYVAFYLFPIYMFPELTDGLSSALKKQRQGKSCFNFNDLDEELFKELEALTEAGFKRFEKEGLI